MLAAPTARRLDAAGRQDGESERTQRGKDEAEEGGKRMVQRAGTHACVRRKREDAPDCGRLSRNVLLTDAQLPTVPG